MPDHVRDDIAGLITKLRTGRVSSCSEADRLLRRLDTLCGSDAASTLALAPSVRFAPGTGVDDLVAALGTDDRQPVTA